MSAPPRRFFWGRTLAQALAKAARHHGVAPERIAYAVLEKRHGFVKHPRAFIVEVDPEHPERAEPPQGAALVSAPAVAAPPSNGAPGRSVRQAAPPTDAVWDAPDEEGELAAAEAAKRLLVFAGLDLHASVRRSEQRLELELDGADRDRLAAAGAEFLDAFEALLPRAVVTLADRRVRCRVDGAGLRATRERELETLAREAASRARAAGEELLPPLSPADRRLVHLALRDEPGLATESVGHGSHRRIRVYLTASPSADR